MLRTRLTRTHGQTDSSILLCLQNKSPASLGHLLKTNIADRVHTILLGLYLMYKHDCIWPTQVHFSSLVETLYNLADKSTYLNSLSQTQTAVFTLLLHLLLSGDYITRIYSYLVQSSRCIHMWSLRWNRTATVCQHKQNSKMFNEVARFCNFL